MAADHHPHRTVTPHGPGGGLTPHGAGSGITTGAHDEWGPIVPPGVSLLATDPPPGGMLIVTEKGEAISVSVE